MITYVDTSVLLKLLVEDEQGSDAVERLWLNSDYLVCAEIGYVEARAALAAVHRNARLNAHSYKTAKSELVSLWSQVDVVTVSTVLIQSAGELAETEKLRGYDAVHLAAGIAAGVNVFASADDRLLSAASRLQMATSNPTTL